MLRLSLIRLASTPYATTTLLSKSAILSKQLKLRVSNTVDPLLGVLVNSPSTDQIEQLASSNFDYMWVDCEHSTLSPQESKMLFMASELHSKPTLTRLGSRCPATINKFLDSGTNAILFPMVNTKADAEFCVAATKFPPLGSRGMSNSRWNGFGQKPDTTREFANFHTLVGIQVETMQSVENLEEIISVPNIDFVFFGPMDLAVDMGLPHTDEKVKELILRCGELIRNKNRAIVLGTLVLNNQEAEFYEEEGFRLNVCLANKFMNDGAGLFLASCGR
ncbi:hypothetical protein ScalyP_jg7046 [Parmales sp. scaly parma]|nr:hypothetical protein ScalyP_jg7046 [Parmales sp. scaly parma]